MFTKAFWKDTAERAISTAAQTALTAIGADALNVLEADFVTLAGFAAGGAALAVLKALVASQRGDSDDASLLGPYQGRHRG